MLDKQKALDIFDDVLANWVRAQGCVIDEGGGVLPYGHEELQCDAEEYRRRFLESLDVSR